MSSSLPSPSPSSNALGVAFHPPPPLSSPALSSIHSISQEGDGDGGGGGGGEADIASMGEVTIASRSSASASVRCLRSDTSRPTQVYTYHHHHSHDEGDCYSKHIFTEVHHGVEGRCLFSRSFASSVCDVDNNHTTEREGHFAVGEKVVRGTTMPPIKLQAQPPMAPPAGYTGRGADVAAKVPSNNININHNASLRANATASTTRHHNHADHDQSQPISHALLPPPPPTIVFPPSASASAAVDETPARVLYPSRAASLVSSQQQCSQYYQQRSQGPYAPRGRGGGGGRGTASAAAKGLLLASQPTRCNFASSATSAHHSNRGLLFGLGSLAAANRNAAASERSLGSTRCGPSSSASQAPLPPLPLLVTQPPQAPPFLRGGAAVAAGSSSHQPSAPSASIASLFYEQYCEATRPSHLLLSNRPREYMYHGGSAPVAPAGAGVLDTARVGLDVSEAVEGEGDVDSSACLDTSRHATTIGAAGDASVCSSLSYSLHMSFLDALAGGGQDESGGADGDGDGDGDGGEALADVSLLSGGCEWGGSDANNANSNAVLPAPCLRLMGHSDDFDGEAAETMLLGGHRRNSFSRCPAPRLTRSSNTHTTRTRHASARKEAPSPAKQTKSSEAGRWNRIRSPSAIVSMSAGAPTAVVCRVRRTSKGASASASTLSHRQRAHQQQLLIGAVDKLLSPSVGVSDDGIALALPTRAAERGDDSLLDADDQLPIGAIGARRADVCVGVGVGVGGPMMIVAHGGDAPPRLGSGAANDHSPLVASTCATAVGPARSSGGDPAALCDGGGGGAHVLVGGSGSGEGFPSNKLEEGRVLLPESSAVPLPLSCPVQAQPYTSSAVSGATDMYAASDRDPQRERHRRGDDDTDDDDTDVDGDADRASATPCVAALYHHYLKRQSRRLRGAWLQ